MGIDKFRRSIFKKLRGARGSPGPLGERGVQGIQGIQGSHGKKGLRGEMGEVSNGFNKTSDKNFNMEGKRLINIGKPVDLSDIATSFTISDAIFKAENPLWKEMATVKEYIDAENMKIYDKLTRFKDYIS